MVNYRIWRRARGGLVVKLFSSMKVPSIAMLTICTCAVLSSGCVAGKWTTTRSSPSSSARKGDAAATGAVANDVAESSSGEELALEAQVREEVYDGEQLGVTVQLKTHAEIDASVVAVRLRLLRGGEMVSDNLIPLPTILATQVLEADQEYLIPLVGHAENLTDYQVELVWGGEAIDLLKTQTTKDLVVTVKEVEKEQVCVESQCGDSYKLKALLEVTNSGKMPCGKVALKVHLAVPGVQSAAKVVRFNSFNLKPGTTTLVRLNFQDVLKKDQVAIPEVSVKECF